MDEKMLFIDISNGPYKAIGRNIQYDQHTDEAPFAEKYGTTFISLHGTASIESGSESYVEIQNTHNLGTQGNWNDDWTITMFVNIPLSQSVTSSYTGDFEAAGNRPNSYENRILSNPDVLPYQSYVLHHQCHVLLDRMDHLKIFEPPNHFHNQYQ